jgi:CubicO group peptidase (beta-lactamase class C family)
MIGIDTLAEGEWAKTAPESAGFDTRALEDAAARTEADATACVHSLLVARYGHLVFERYFTAPFGEAGRRGPPVRFDADAPHMLRSITKTIVALLFGIARAAGHFPDLDAPILDALPGRAALATPANRRVTIRHALTMTGGFAWNEWRSPPCDLPDSCEAAMTGGDPSCYLLTSAFEHEPGARLNYNSMLSHLLVEAMEAALGEPVKAFARRVLWEPLGIAEPSWETVASGGPVLGGWGIDLRPRDLARIGQLILERGVWRGRRIVPAAWIGEMTAQHVAVADPIHLAPGYGYQIWIGRSESGGRGLVHFDGKGAGGQFLSVVPDLDLVFVMTAGYRGEDRQNSEPLEFLDRHILPFVSGGKG